MRVSYQVIFEVPVDTGDYAPETITLQAPPGRLINRLSVVPDDAVAVADYMVELWALKLGGDPTNADDYVYLCDVEP